MAPDGGIRTSTYVPADRLAGKSPTAPTPQLDADLQAELDAFVAQEKTALGLDEPTHWRDVVNDRFTAADRPHTTILVSGLTYAHDTFVVAEIGRAHV